LKDTPLPDSKIGQSLASYNLTDGLVLWMHFNNDVAEFLRNSDTCLSDFVAQPHSSVGEDYNSSNGSVIYDYSGLGNNGTSWGDLPYNASGGKFGGAFDFDGDED